MWQNIYIITTHTGGAVVSYKGAQWKACDVGAHISQNLHCLKHCFGISYVFCVEESTFNRYMIEIKGQRNVYLHLHVFLYGI